LAPVVIVPSRPLVRIGTRTPGMGRQPTQWAPVCVLLPVRTFTVGPGVPPGQPIVDRLADYDRRCGVPPPPEHASLRSDSVCHTVRALAVSSITGLGYSSLPVSFSR